MKKIKIATWNVNSLRVRLPHVLAWLATEKPDVLALQETKTPDEDFPLAEINQAGYHVVFSGQRTYNGMAVLSREEGSGILTDIPSMSDPQRRVLGVAIGNYYILNLYVPNGESVESEKYQYKLNWLQQVTQFLSKKLTTDANIIVLGDFNIAPADIDVYDPKAWAGQVLCSPPERAAFQAMLALGFQDCFRALAPEAERFTWWDYRMNAFKRKRGLRIDHILASAPLVEKCVRCEIDEAPRALERPSDHAPIWAEFLT